MDQKESSAYWERKQKYYSTNINTEYHLSRSKAIDSLIGEVKKGINIVDYGCGEGIYLSKLYRNANFLWGIDINEEMLKDAQSNFKELNYDESKYKLIHGGVETLNEIPDKSADIMLVLNVLAYMSDSEQINFFNQCKRLLKQDGFIVATHSNELFDLFTLNSFTYKFFEKHFDVDIKNLIMNHDKPMREDTDIISRENPLEIKDKYAQLGLSVDSLEFAIPHKIPPIIDLNHDPDDLENRKVETCMSSKEYIKNKRTDFWKLYFRCSTFGAKISII